MCIECYSGFSACSLPIVGYSSLHCGTIPVNVVILMSMDIDTFLGVASLHCLFALAESHLVCTKSSVIIPFPPPPPLYFPILIVLLYYPIYPLKL